MSTVSDNMRSMVANWDLTPMIDCTFLLIIFFMCVTEMARKEFEQVSLPKATKAVDDRKPPRDRQVINITYEPSAARVLSAVKIRGEDYSDTDKLFRYLDSKAKLSNKDDKGFPTLQVKIRADGRVEYSRVQHVMMACMKAHISRVSIGCEPRKGS